MWTRRKWKTDIWKLDEKKGREAERSLWDSGVISSQGVVVRFFFQEDGTMQERPEVRNV